MGTIKAANGLARILRAEGVEWVSTFPISSVNNALGEEGVPMLMMRDERYAVGLADAFSRVTSGKKIGVAAVMGGVNSAGIQMAYPAIAQAFEDGAPVLCVTDGLIPGGTALTHYDIPMAFAPVTKWIGRIEVPCNVPEVMRRAYTQLRTGRPGPVLVTIPGRLGEYDEDEMGYKPVKGWKYGPDPDDVKAAVRALLSAKKPLLFAGEGIFYGDATEELRTFAELARVPVVTSLKGKSAFPENHPLSAGMRGDLATHYLQTCDLLFAVGASLFARYSHGVPGAKDKIVVQCNVDQTDVNRGYRADHALIGDAKLTLRALCDELANQTGGGVTPNQTLVDEIRVGKEQGMSKYRALMESNDKPINPYRVYGDLMRVLDPHSSFVTADSGGPRDQLSTVYEAIVPRSYLGWGNVTTLGFSLAGAMAAKLAHPGWQCVNVSGDAGVSFMLANFEALVRYDVGITTIHINNGGFGGYGPGFWGAGHTPYNAVVSDHSVADMSESAKALGCYAEHVSEPSEIIPALRRAFDENARSRPAYLEFICCQYPVYAPFAPAS